MLKSFKLYKIVQAETKSLSYDFLEISFKTRYTREIPDLVYCPLVMVLSPMGAQIEGLWVFADHIHKSKCKTNAYTIFVPHVMFYACLSSRSDSAAVDAGDIRT